MEVDVGYQRLCWRRKDTGAIGKGNALPARIAAKLVPFHDERWGEYAEHWIEPCEINAPEEGAHYPYPLPRR